MSEFTGERVIPGQVNDDLWAEHITRYAFARTFAARTTLDIGSGAGYGVAELAKSGATVTGVDVAADAINYARANYALPNVHFAQASATALPFHNGSFDLVTAFEVIEHLNDWNALLAEARRVLRDVGVFLVSTPNRSYYAESRADRGPNPFHVHEFEFDEFREALARVFPNVSVLLQNWCGSISLTPPQASTIEARVDAVDYTPESAHFFLAICSAQPIPAAHGLLYLPRASNILREREQHIHLLERELEQSKEWLATTTAERDALLNLNAEQKQQIEERNRWALKVEQDWKAAMERVVYVQDQLQLAHTGYTEKITDLEQEHHSTVEWATETQRYLEAKSAELAETVRLLDAAETTVVERTLWAQRAQARVDELEAHLAMIRRSRWVRIGSAIGAGPKG